jgi:glycosyltransferase involved in cell wall biosynthesis
MTYKVSVIIPTYKRSEFLERAIESVLNQSYKNIEILVIDDNEEFTDFRMETEKKMEKYLNDIRVKYYKNIKNLGGALARNEGIHKAEGDYITFLDDDDEYQNEKIQNQVNYMVANNLDMSFTNLKYVNSKKKIIEFREFTDLKFFDKISLLKYHLMRHLTGTPTFMYKADILKKIGGFEDAEMGQEFYLMIKTIENKLKIGYLNDSQVIAYRHKEGGISFGINKIKGEEKLYNFKTKYFNILNNKEKRFIRFRHYAVMSIAHKRNKGYIKFLYYFIVMILSSPIDFIKELYRLTKNTIISKREVLL